jgi:prepilin-type N-terminal cleavage/methylation domain-containing protein
MKNVDHTENSKKKRGFSLVELLVATALFTIVVAVSAGSFLSILEASRQSRELNNLMLAVDFAMEDMSRTMRTGVGFPSSHSADQITFADENGAEVTYRRNGSAIEKRVRNSLNSSDNYNYTRLTPADVNISYLQFSHSSPPNNQPRIIINVVGRLGSDPDDMFYLQTSVTQRELNI